MTSCTLSWGLHVHIFMFLCNTVYFFTPGASMWFYFRVSWKDPILYSTCRYGTVARWIIQNIPGHLPSWNNTIIGWICGNYTLQPKNEIQCQYYHSEKVSIMVHIMYRHGPDSNEEKRVILKEIHFYISDDRTHHIHYVQHYFKLFYDHVIV